MKVTKFQHACFAVEKDGSTIVVDPGAYSHDFIIPKQVTAVIITHDHPDHLDPKLLSQIIAAHPKAMIIGHESITATYSTSPTIAVKPGEQYTAGAFSLEFFGGEHAPIAEDVTTPANYGVLIDKTLYYPGDSFTVPFDSVTHQPIPIATLALPISAPWLDFVRTKHFLTSVHPSLAFPTHDGILSEDGKALAERMVGGVAHSLGAVYKRLDGESIQLA
jgi:L-ascorbate metabolism protein UlaG (beta-lactamase superfamily)